MKKIATTLFSIYACLAFGINIFIAFLAYVMFFGWFGKLYEKKFLRFLYGVIAKMIVLSLLLKVKKQIHGSYNKDKSYVVVSNHQTMIDIPANVVGKPDEVLIKFLGKKEANRIPFFGYLINRTCVLVDRKDPESRKASYQKMKEEMEFGYSIFLYPEGTRNRTNEPLKEFYDGAFRLAIEMQAPLVVNTLTGIRELNPPTGVLTLRPGTITSHYEEPISTLGMTQEDLPRLKQQVKHLMEMRLKAHYDAS